MNHLSKAWRAFVRWTRLLSVQMTAAMYGMMFLAVVLPIATIVLGAWFFYIRGQNSRNIEITSVNSDAHYDDTFMTLYRNILDDKRPKEGSRAENFLEALEQDIARFEADKALFYAIIRAYEGDNRPSKNPLDEYERTLHYSNVEARADSLLAYMKEDYQRFQDKDILAEALRAYDLQTRNAFIIITFFIVVELFLLLLGIWLARRITKRTVHSIKAVVDVSNQVAAGDFAARVPAIKPRQSSEEARLLAQNFNTMTNALAKLEQERRSTLAAIAHELRTPLTIMQGKLDLLQEGIDPLDLEHIAKLSRHTELLSRLVDDLRTLSLAEAQRLSLNVMPVELVHFCHDIAENFSDNDKAIHVQCETTLVEHWLELDPDRMAQILGNLLSNAIRYSPKNSLVQLRLRSEDDGTYIHVSDQGEGIPPDQLRHIFKNFYRSEDSRERAKGGSGLGLAVVKALVNLHGGNVWAENLFEGGAIFTVLLPSQAKASLE